LGKTRILSDASLTIIRRWARILKSLKNLLNTLANQFKYTLLMFDWSILTARQMLLWKWHQCDRHEVCLAWH
jgi:hypothetical protein